MTKRCLDEGSIQSYLDGELSPEEFARAEAHMASCASCAAAAREAEAELALFVSAFEADASLSVPTERLRERVESAVSDLQAAQRREASRAEAEGWSVRRWFASLAESLALTPARAAAFGGVAAVLTFAAIFAVVQSNVRKSSNEMARVQTQPADTRPAGVPATADANTHEQKDASGETNDVQNGTANVRKAAPSRSAGNSSASAVRVRDNRPRESRRGAERAVRPPDAGEKLLPGEGKYLQSIASLEQTVKRVSDRVLQPSVRAEFETNVAVVDQAISASRRNALRNPKDAEAAKFLFSAYQSKVELLSAVVEQAQVATLGR